VSTVVRTWNLFHGNTKPPGRKAYLKEMVRLAADGADVVLLQELPVWSFGHLEAWSGLRAFPVVAQRPSLGPLPGSAGLGRAVTDLNHGLLRSAFTGQGNAILAAARLRPRDAHSIPLNPRSFRKAQSEWLELPLVPRLAWGKERRVVQAVRVEPEDGQTLVVGNLHATAFGADRRLADAELLRAAVYLDGLADAGEPVVLGGDLNVEPGESRTLPDLASEEWGFSGASDRGVDHLLVRGVAASPPRRWPPERRRHGDVLLSDHAPVEVTLG
jgi:endonuclease/exonuclease/phosphatase family metal-dependent hydrolase